MTLTRRDFLSAGLLGLALPRLCAAATGRVVIVGAGWGGLAAARYLAHAAPALEISLLDRRADFVVLPGLNRWLSGDAGLAAMHRPLHSVSSGRCRFIQDEVEGIDLAAKVVHGRRERLGYDWLILAPGIEERWSVLSAGDEAAARHLAARYASGSRGGSDFVGLRERMQRFSGGHFLMNVPPAPYRCPPAPYERAVQVASRIRRLGLKARLTLIDPNAPWSGFQRVFRAHFSDIVTYLPQTPLRRVDGLAKVASTDMDELPFDEAILMPPQAAGALCQQAGLLRPVADGLSDWAGVQDERLRSMRDPALWIVGDSVGVASSLFGHFPKTGGMAMAQGRIVAEQIVAEAAGRAPVLSLPASECFAQLSSEPEEWVQISARYQKRGDGLLLQRIEQQRILHPDGEAERWLAGALAELFPV